MAEPMSDKQREDLLAIMRLQDEARRSPTGTWAQRWLPWVCKHEQVRCTHGDEIVARNFHRRVCLVCGRALKGDLPETCFFSPTEQPHTRVSHPGIRVLRGQVNEWSRRESIVYVGDVEVKRAWLPVEWSDDLVAAHLLFGVGGLRTEPSARAMMTLEAFLERHPGCCQRCGWSLSSHGHSHGHQSDCPNGESPAAKDGSLAMLRRFLDGA